MKYRELISLALMVTFFISCSTKEIKVAIVGDSITEGYGLSNQSRNAYPVMVDSILGSDDCLKLWAETLLFENEDAPIGSAVNFIMYLLTNQISL